MTKRMLIVLFGPDSSGKSTLAKALADKLRRRNLRASVSWMRGTHTLASLLARFLSRFAIFKGSDNPYYGISIPDYAKRVWQLIEFVSMLPILLVRFMLLYFLGYVVVAERYLPDFLVWVSLTTRDTGYLRNLEAKFMLALSAKTSVKVYVTASKAEITKRRSKEVSSEFLGRQLELYDKVAKLISAHRIDTTGRNVEEALAHLLSLCQKSLKCTDC